MALTNGLQHPPTSGFGPSKFGKHAFQDTDMGDPDGDDGCTFPGERRKVGYHPPCALVIEVQDRLVRGDTAINDIRTAQQELKDDTAEVLEILHNAKTFFKFAKFFGRLLAFFAPLVAVWLTWKGLVK